MRGCLIVGVAGGSGSGKTTLAEGIIARLGPERVAYLQHDAYYRDRSHLPPEERERANFDHPDALETELLVQHLELLCAGRVVEVPIYDFTTHTRRLERRMVQPKPVILLEGILLLADADLRRLLDIKIYVDTDADIRFIRRLERDMAERGRTMEAVIAQYLSTVRPMHLEFVEPSKRYADIVIPEGGLNDVAASVAARLERMLQGDEAR